MFLFTINRKEDTCFMMEGLRKGLLSRKRLDEAVTRILALKAYAGLWKGAAVPPKEKLSCLRCPEHLAAARKSRSAALRW